MYEHRPATALEIVAVAHYKSRADPRPISVIPAHFAITLESIRRNVDEVCQCQRGDRPHFVTPT